MLMIIFFFFQLHKFLCHKIIIIIIWNYKNNKLQISTGSDIHGVPNIFKISGSSRPERPSDALEVIFQPEIIICWNLFIFFIPGMSSVYKN